MKRHIHNFVFRLKRGWSWFKFSFKQHPWQEDYQLFETIEKVLLDTANYFEERERKGWVVDVDNQEEIADMRLAAKLIRMRLNDHYSGLYMESQKNPEYKGGGDIEDWFRKDGKGAFLPTYSSDDAIEASKKDQKALALAMKIIAQKGFHWWI